ncbi:MAG: protein-glutamate O-methyltransferase CheR, partial [Bryocella sp.]
MLRSEAMVRPVAMHRVVAEAMTIRETSFFRDHLPWEMLAQCVLPELLAKRRAEKRLRVWSAGCATGQETYSLAMLMMDRSPELDAWDVAITGTDLSPSACTYGRRGRYSRLEINRGLPVRQMLRYFERQGEEWVVKPVVRRLVLFEQGDLRMLTEGGAGFDLVLLRNVLPYFSAADRDAVLVETHSRVKPGGVLLLGATEQIDDA